MTLARLNALQCNSDRALCGECIHPALQLRHFILVCMQMWSCDCSDCSHGRELARLHAFVPLQTVTARQICNPVCVSDSGPQYTCVQPGRKYLDDNSSDVEGHQRVCCHEEIKQSADMLEIVHAVSKPGYEPSQGKEGRHFCSSQLVMHFSISLYIGSILYAAGKVVSQSDHYML